MDFDQQDKELRELFKKHPLKKVPGDLLKDYEAGVLRKMHMRPQGMSLGIQVTLGLSLAAIFIMAAFYFWPAVISSPKQVAPVVKPEPLALSEPVVVKVSATEEVTFEEAAFEEVAEDLLLLEMLDEDEGLLPEAIQVKTDLELFPAASF